MGGGGVSTFFLSWPLDRGPRGPGIAKYCSTDVSVEAYSPFCFSLKVALSPAVFHRLQLSPGQLTSNSLITSPVLFIKTQ